MYYKGLRYFSLKGIDFVEPSFATIRKRSCRCTNSYVHGVATKLDLCQDAEKLNKQEAVGRAYNFLVAKDFLLYDKKTYMDVEIYVI